jgi:hypothetical protein
MRKAIRKFVSQQFGFKQNSITPLECSMKDMQFEYIMFEVCGIEYQARIVEDNWDLTIFAI